VFGYFLWDSDGVANSNSYGVYPLITLGTTLELDNSVSGMDGTELNPWKFVK
jgi:hypothetical protein